MTDQPPFEPNQPMPNHPPPPPPQPGQPQPGHPQLGYAAGPQSGQYQYGPPARRGPRPWLVGLLAGLVLGAGGLGLVWALSGSDGIEADAEAVCGIVDRSVIPTEDTPPDEFRRWGVSEVAVSMAERDAKYQPLADELDKALRAMQTFDFDEMGKAANRAKEICDDL